MTARLLVANIGAEEELGQRTTSKLARRRSAALATLCRAFASDGDVLWLPAAVDAASLPPTPGWLRLAQVDLRWGGLPRSWDGPVSHWCITSRTALPGSPRETPVIPGETLEPEEVLTRVFWAGPSSDPSVVRWANDKRSLPEIALAAGIAVLPRTEVVSSVNQLRRLVEANETWILKAPWGASGRHRYIGKSIADADDPRVAALLASEHSVLFQPWMHRLEDWGASGAVLGDTVITYPSHQQDIDHRGQFCGAIFRRGEAGAMDASLQNVVLATGHRLRQAGYNGLFGIDAFVYQTPGSTPELQPLGELNARCTFGILGRLLALRAFTARPELDHVALCLGTDLPKTSNSTIPLVAPTSRAPVAAWLQCKPS